nr:immunoglobulin light chain junction region [Macaca mulatta]
CQQYNSLPFSC